MGAIIRKRIENLSLAVAFAEANDHETALRLSPLGRRSGQWRWTTTLTNVFAGVALAESGLPETAVALADEACPPTASASLADFVRSVGLGGARLRFGVVYV